MDSGATDHMTNAFIFFDSYAPCPSNKKIVTGDSFLTIVAGTCIIKFSSHFIIPNVVYVPKMKMNLILVTKLFHDLDCKIIFSYSLSKF